MGRQEGLSDGLDNEQRKTLEQISTIAPARTSSGVASELCSTRYTEPVSGAYYFVPSNQSLARVGVDLE